MRSRHCDREAARARKGDEKMGRIRWMRYRRDLVEGMNVREEGGKRILSTQRGAPIPTLRALTLSRPSSDDVRTSQQPSGSSQFA